MDDLTAACNAAIIADFRADARLNSWGASRVWRFFQCVDLYTHTVARILDDGRIVLQVVLIGDPRFAWEGIVPAGGWLTEDTLRQCFAREALRYQVYMVESGEARIAFGEDSGDNKTTFKRVTCLCDLRQADVATSVAAAAGIEAYCNTRGLKRDLDRLAEGAPAPARCGCCCARRG